MKYEQKNMANEFERAMVICINRYFTEHRMKGFAYRLKQAHFNTRYAAPHTF